MKNNKAGSAVGVLYVLMAGVMWGSIGVFVKHLNAAGFSSRQITAMRCIVCALFMLILILATDKSRLKIELRDIIWFVLNGCTSVLIFNTAYQASISMTSMSTAVALLYTAPVFVLIMSIIFFKERFTTIKGVSVVLSIVGSALVSGIIGGFVANVPGVALGLLSGLGYAMYSIFSVIILRKYHIFTNIFYTFLIAGAAAFLLGNPIELVTMLKEPATLLWAVGNGLVTGFFAYLFYTLGLTKMPASRASVLATIEPVTATLIGIFVYKEQLGFYGAVGICMVIGAILLQNVKTSKNN